MRSLFNARVHLGHKAGCRHRWAWVAVARPGRSGPCLEVQASLFSLFSESVLPFSSVVDRGVPGRDRCLFSESACSSPQSLPWGSWSSAGAGRLVISSVSRRWMGAGKATLWEGRPKARLRSSDWPSFSGGRCEGLVESELVGRCRSSGKGVAQLLGQSRSSGWAWGDQGGAEQSGCRRSSR